jgi:hypothetical protein
MRSKEMTACALRAHTAAPVPASAASSDPGGGPGSLGTAASSKGSGVPSGEKEVGTTAGASAEGGLAQQ